MNVFNNFKKLSLYQLSQKHGKQPCMWVILFSLFLSTNDIVNYKDQVLLFIVVALATDLFVIYSVKLKAASLRSVFRNGNE